MPKPVWLTQLQTGWQKLFDQQIPQQTEDQFEIYLNLLINWNKTYNLTQIYQPEEIVTKHFLDSLSIAPYVKGPNIADIGSGAGFPGIPLAIHNPKNHITLIESRGKKTAFLQQLKIETGINNITIEKKRVEQYTPNKIFNTITSRAFSSLPHFFQVSAHLGDKDSIFLAMKGTQPTKELLELPNDIQLKAQETIKVPGLTDQRCLITLQKN